MSAADFTAHRHPVLAVGCPDCRATAGAMCRRPSGHRAADFHQSRKAVADELFVRQHGEDASIERLAGNRWRIDPHGRRPLTSRQMAMTLDGVASGEER